MTAFKDERALLTGYHEGEWIDLWGAMGFSKGVGSYEGRVFPQVVLKKVIERKTTQDTQRDDEGGYITEDEEDVPL